MTLGETPTKQLVVERRDLVIVHQHCPDRPYLELVVPEDFHAALYIEFTAESRDQGMFIRPSSPRP